MPDSLPSLSPTPTTTNHDNDPQVSVSTKPTGYSHLSNLMSHHPELAIFRRFSKLNIQSLLYLQAELTHLEEDLEKLTQRDRKRKGRGEVWDRYWWFLSNGVEVNLDAGEKSDNEREEDGEHDEHDEHDVEERDDEGVDIEEIDEEKEVVEKSVINDDAGSDRPSNISEQWEMWLRIREVLKEYNSTLTQVSTLSSGLLPPSQKYNLNFLRSWLTRPRMGNFPLDGPDHASWAPVHEHDLLSLSPAGGSSSLGQSGGAGNGREPTPLSRWVIYRFIPWFHNILGNRFMPPVEHDPASEITDYPDGALHSFIRILIIVIASLIPISSIVVLYFVESTLDRLGVCVAFTAVFAFALAVTTRARGVEVWAGSCAFAAVQVVFITGNGT